MYWVFIGLNYDIHIEQGWINNKELFLLKLYFIYICYQSIKFRLLRVY